MKPLRSAVAGTLESSDVLVRIRPAETFSLTIQSPVAEQYGEAIRTTCHAVCEAVGLEAGEIELIDRGALDCTIRARLETAIGRACGEEATE